MKAFADILVTGTGASRIALMELGHNITKKFSPVGSLKVMIIIKSDKVII